MGRIIPESVIVPLNVTRSRVPGFLAYVCHRVLIKCSSGVLLFRFISVYTHLLLFLLTVYSWFISLLYYFKWKSYCQLLVPKSSRRITRDYKSKGHPECQQFFNSWWSSYFSYFHLFQNVEYAGFSYSIEIFLRTDKWRLDYFDCTSL